MKLYRLIFVGKAFILLVSIFLINHGITIGKILNVCGVTCITIDLPDAISYAIYVVVPVFLTYLNPNRSLGPECVLHLKLPRRFPESEESLSLFPVPDKS